MMMTTTAISRTTPTPVPCASSSSSLLPTPTKTRTTSFLPPVVQYDLNHPSVQPAIQAVLESWKQCRNYFIVQEHEFEQTFGKLLLIRLFDLEPRLKPLFGFHMNIDPTATSLGEMALILCAVRLTQQLGQVLEMLENDHHALKQLLLGLSRQRKDYLIKSRDIPLMGQALIHAVSTIMTSEDENQNGGNKSKNKSPVWNDSLMLAWQHVIGAMSFQVIDSSSSASATSSTRRTRKSGGKPNMVKKDTTDESSRRSRSRRPQPSSSMPLRQPLRQPSLPEAQGYPGGESETVVWIREVAPRQMPQVSPSWSFRNMKSQSRHHRRHQPVSAASVPVTKTTTTTTTYHTTTSTTMSDSSGSVDYSIMNVEYNFNNNNKFVGNSNSNEKKSASFEAMNYTTTTMRSGSRHHTSSSLHASMGSYTKENNMGRVSTSRQQCNFNMTKSSSFTVIPQAYFVVFPPLENDNGSCSGRSFGAIEAVPETLLMHASFSSSSLLLPQAQHASQKKMSNNIHHHHHKSSSHSFNIGSSSRNNSATGIGRGDCRLLTRGGSMMKKQPPVRVASARKLYITSS